MTLSTGQVDCKVSNNIRQQQYERMIGYACQTCLLPVVALTCHRPIAFHPPSVLFEVPSHAELMEKVGVRSMISDVIEELLQIATSQGCTFDEDFKQKTIQNMTKPSDSNSIMYQDFAAKRPMEVETYLGSPIKLAQESGLRVPRIETIYALLHHCNIVNQQRPAGPPLSPNPPSGPTPPPRLLSVPPPRSGMNGSMNGQMDGNGMHGMRGGRNSSLGPPMRRGGPSANGYPPRQANGYPPRGPPPNQMTRRPSFEGNDLEEFSHLVLYDDIPEGGVAPGYGEMGNGAGVGPADLALRERELNLRQKELQLREQEYHMRRGPRRPAPSHRGGYDDDDDDDDFFDPMAIRGTPQPQIDPDNFDMMSVTSRRNRKAPSLSQIRKDPESGLVGRGGGMRQSHSYSARNGTIRNRSSAQLVSTMPGMNDPLMDNPMMGYSSNRYGNVDRKVIQNDSRANSLTAARLNELQGPGNNPGMNGAYPGPIMRRTSQSPGNPLNAGPRMMGRPSPPNDGYAGPGGVQQNGGPPPPGMMRQPVPRYPPGQGNAVAPQQVEQHAGVSNLYPPKGPMQKNVRSLTGSASASAGSGDSGASAQIDSENSAHSSSSSLGPRHALGVQGQAIGVN